jgi:hypothetical protein
MTPIRFVLYMLISSLLAPYAWVFDFAPFVIITYAVAVVAMQKPSYTMRRWGSIAVLIALCLPFEALFTSNLQAYALHPLLVAVLFLHNRRDIRDLFEATKYHRA